MRSNGPTATAARRPRRRNRSRPDDGASHPVRHLGHPATERLDRIRELVRAGDRAGIDFAGIQDHPYQRHFLDTWSLIPALLAETERIPLFTDVANVPLRSPAVMAKAAASIDLLRGGRFELRLGP